MQLSKINCDLFSFYDDTFNSSAVRHPCLYYRSSSSITHALFLAQLERYTVSVNAQFSLKWMVSLSQARPNKTELYRISKYDVSAFQVETWFLRHDLKIH